MKGLILVGGYGTRLRPLTLSVPKPLIHFCNKPMIEYQINALVKIGVRHVILAVAYKPDTMVQALRELEIKYSVKISCSIENEPMLTAGPIKLAEKLLFTDEEFEIHPELFFVFNSDIVAAYPLKEMLDFHLKHKKDGTICLTTVDNPSMFGVVLYNKHNHQITRFIEKPTNWVSNCINAGMYLFHRRMICKRIENRPTSIEKEVFPSMAKDEDLYAYELSSYWADIGKPKDFLSGTQLYLQSLKNCEANALELGQSLKSGPNIVGNVIIHAGATINEGCVIGPDVCIGEGCIVGQGCRISNSTLLNNVHVGDFVKIDSSIIGWNSMVGKWCRVDGLTVLGEDVQLEPELYINGAFVLPNRIIKTNITEVGTIVM